MEVLPVAKSVMEANKDSTQVTEEGLALIHSLSRALPNRVCGAIFTPAFMPYWCNLPS